MIILVCGDRNWTDEAVIEREIYNVMLDAIARCQFEEPLTIIEGGAMGADTRAGRIAKKYGWKLEVYKANWKEHFKAAGPIRNNLMLKEGKPDIVLAFHEDITKSKGTKHMIGVANKAGIPVRLFSK